MSVPGVGDEFVKWYSAGHILNDAQGFGWVFKHEPEFEIVWVLFVRLHNSEAPEVYIPGIPLSPDEVVPWPPRIQKISIEAFTEEGETEGVFQTRAEAHSGTSVIPHWIKEDPRVIEAFNDYIGWRTPRYDGAPSIKWM